MPYYDANLKSRLFVFSLPLDIQPLDKNKKSLRYFSPKETFMTAIARKCQLNTDSILCLSLYFLNSVVDIYSTGRHIGNHFPVEGKDSFL